MLQMSRLLGELGPSVIQNQLQRCCALLHYCQLLLFPSLRKTFHEPLEPLLSPEDAAEGVLGTLKMADSSHRNGFVRTRQALLGDTNLQPRPWLLLEGEPQQ